MLFAGGLERLARWRRSGYDSLTALVLVGALVIGVILASDVFYSGLNINKLLFGSLLAIGPGDVVLAAVVSGLTLAATYLFGRVWLATGFDPSASRSLGVRSAVPDALLLGLIALVATAALSTVGALLATTLVVVPAAARGCSPNDCSLGNSVAWLLPPSRVQPACGSLSRPTLRLGPRPHCSLAAYSCSSQRCAA